MKELDAAIREKDQARAAALTARIGAEKPDTAKDVFGAAPRVRGQRGRRAARREVLRHDVRRVRRARGRRSSGGNWSRSPA